MKTHLTASNGPGNCYQLHYLPEDNHKVKIDFADLNLGSNKSARRKALRMIAFLAAALEASEADFDKTQ